MVQILPTSYTTTSKGEQPGSDCTVSKGEHPSGDSSDSKGGDISFISENIISKGAYITLSEVTSPPTRPSV